MQEHWRMKYLFKELTKGCWQVTFTYIVDRKRLTIANGNLLCSIARLYGEKLF